MQILVQNAPKEMDAIGVTEIVSGKKRPQPV